MAVFCCFRAHCIDFFFQLLKFHPISFLHFYWLKYIDGFVFLLKLARRSYKGCHRNEWTHHRGQTTLRCSCSAQGRQACSTCFTLHAAYGNNASTTDSPVQSDVSARCWGWLLLACLTPGSAAVLCTNPDAPDACKPTVADTTCKYLWVFCLSPEFSYRQIALWFWKIFSKSFASFSLSSKYNSSCRAIDQVLYSGREQAMPPSSLQMLSRFIGRRCISAVGPWIQAQLERVVMIQRIL